MPPSKSGDQVLQDVHDDAADALRVISTGGGSPPATTVLRSSNTGAAGIAITTAFAKKMKIRSVTGKASGAVVEALTITLDSLTGPVYDAPLPTVAAGWTGFAWLPEGEFILEAGDEISIACANSGTKTYGIEVIAEELA